MQQISAERLHAIIKCSAVTDAMTPLTAYNLALVPVLLERAHEALQVAVELAESADHDLTDEALTSIAVRAVQTIAPDAEPLALHHTIVSWLGPANVPNNLRFSWEPGAKGKKAAPTPRDFDPDKIAVQGDPSALRKHMTAPIPEITAERGAELVGMQNTMAVVDAALLGHADVYRALGRIEGLDFLRRVGDVAIAQTFIEVRESKKYKGMPFKDAQGNLRHVEDFETFCKEFFGKSYTRCYELSKNLHLLGPDLYESAEAIGFKARDYAALKALPADEQEIVKTALAAESKDQVLDILQDLAARHQSERQAMKKQAEDMTGDLAARDKLLADKSEKLDKVSLDLEKLKSLPPNKREELRLEQEQAAAQKLSTGVMAALAEVNTFLLMLAEIKEAEVSAYTKEHADQTASWFCQQIQLALQENGIQADMAEIALPEWMREPAKQSPVAEA